MAPRTAPRVSGVSGSPEPMRLRPASRRRWWTLGLGVMVALQLSSVAYYTVGHAPLLRILLAVALTLLFGAQLVQQLTLTTVDHTGVHTRWRTQPWGDVRGVRVSRWADAVVLELEGGKERQLGLPTSDGERVAALAGVPLVNPPRL